MGYNRSRIAELTHSRHRSPLTGRLARDTWIVGPGKQARFFIPSDCLRHAGRATQ